MDAYVVPYFFAQSYYSKNKEWLIGDLHHGFVGLLQWLGRLDDYDDDDIRATYNTLKGCPDWDTAKIFIEYGTPGHFPCPCGSGKKIRECHPEVKTAVARIRGLKSSASVAI